MRHDPNAAWTTRFRRWYLGANDDFFESPRARRERVFMHSLYVVAPIIVLTGLFNILLGEWYFSGARLSLFAVILAAYLLNRARRLQAATNLVFWGVTVIMGVVSYLVPASSSASKATAGLFAASLATGSVIIMGLYAKRRYQVDVMFAVALVVNLLAYSQVGDTRAQLVRVAVPVFLILLLCYAIARFEMHLSLLAENQLSARRVLNDQLEEIHVTESLALARQERQFEESNHDIRNPLTVALNTLRLLRATELTDEQRWYLDTLEQSHSTILSIAEGRAKSGTGKAAVDTGMRRIQLATFLEQVVMQYSSAASAKGTSIETHVPQEIAPVTAPLTDLTRVLGNLLHNAIKYTAGGKIDVFASVSSSGLTITVKDSGQGMSAARLADVRSGTYGPDESHVSSRGIGLRSARELLRTHGGFLEIDSREGAGTTVKVSIELPADEEAP